LHFAEGRDTLGTVTIDRPLPLSGVIPANILPFDADLQIDEPAYRRHLESLVAVDGVGAITCNGHAGEVSSLSPDERRRALRIAAETVDGRVPLIAGLYAENARDAAELARQAKADGADALLVFPPYVLAYDAPRDTAYAHFAAVADAVDLPLVVFMYPDWSGVQYDTDTLVRICEVPTVAAVKEWTLSIRVDERNREAVRSLGRPIAMLSSFSTNLLPSLVGGADGILSGHGSVIAPLQVELLRAVDAGRLSEAQALYRRIQHLTAVIYKSPMANMYARMKAHLIMLGHELTPAVRPPLVAVSDAEWQRLREALVHAGLDTPVAAE
jgi:4-hydroxy-tetrahydrodipicolinate synthase